MKNTRNTEWKTHLGNNVTVRGMSDEHLANTIQYVENYTDITAWKGSLPVLKKEAKLRGLSQEFLDRAPFPYKDGLGNWIVWDYDNDEPKAIGSYARD